MKRNKLTDLIGLIEAAGYDWLVRSNKFPDRHVSSDYFANITKESAVTPAGFYNPNFQSFPAYGDSADDALENAYELLKRHN